MGKLIVALLLVLPCAFAQPAFVNFVTNPSRCLSATTCTTDPMVVTAHNTIVLAVAGSFISGDTWTVTSSVSDTVAAKTKNPSSLSQDIQMFVVKDAIGGGAVTFTVTSSSSEPGLDIAASQYSGADNTSSGDVDVVLEGSGTTITSNTFTTTFATETIIMAATNAGNTCAAGTGYTERVNLGSCLVFMEDKGVTTIQTGVTATATSPNAPYNTAVVSIKASGGPATPTTRSIWTGGIRK